MFVRLETRPGRVRVKLVRGFRGPAGEVRQAVFELPADPGKLRELARRLLDAARRLEQQATQAASRLAPETAPPPQQPVIFLSPHAGLRLMGGPRGTVAFTNGRYETADPAEAAWLRAHPEYGLRFREQAP